MNKTLRTFFILAAINALFAIAGVTFDMDGLAMLLLLTASIVISLLIVLIVFIVQTRKKYVSKDTIERKKSKRMMILIAIITVVVLAISWVVLSFQSGYKIPTSDKHKDWSYFPVGSNPDMIIEPIKNLYIYNVVSVKDSDYYFVHFTNDSIEFYDSNIGGQVRFGIMNGQGDFKIKYDKEVYALLSDDGTRLIVMETTYGNDPMPLTCDVYNTKTLELTKEPLNSISIPEAFDPYLNEDGKKEYIKKYGNTFFENLKGVKSLEEKPIYAASDKNRGYILYEDNEGKLYKLDDYEKAYSLNILCEKCNSYTLEVSEYGAKTKVANITMNEEPIIFKNNLNSGVSIAYGSPNGGTDGVYFGYYQTWLMYYTATIGKNTTSFKVEGGEKDWPYIRFYQLNTVSKDNDTLYVIAESKIWKIYHK